MECNNTGFIPYKIDDYFYKSGETELERRYSRDVEERGTNINYLNQSHNERRIQYEVVMHPYNENFDIIIKSNQRTFTIEKNTLNLT